MLSAFHTNKTRPGTTLTKFNFHPFSYILIYTILKRKCLIVPVFKYIGFTIYLNHLIGQVLVKSTLKHQLGGAIACLFRCVYTLAMCKCSISSWCGDVMCIANMVFLFCPKCILTKYRVVFCVEVSTSEWHFESNSS